MVRTAIQQIQMPPSCPHHAHATSFLHHHRWYHAPYIEDAQLGRVQIALVTPAVCWCLRPTSQSPACPSRPLGEAQRCRAALSTISRRRSQQVGGAPVRARFMKRWPSPCFYTTDLRPSALGPWKIRIRSVLIFSRTQDLNECIASEQSRSPD